MFRLVCVFADAYISRRASQHQVFPIAVCSAEHRNSIRRSSMGTSLFYFTKGYKCSVEYCFGIVRKITSGATPVKQLKYSLTLLL